MEIPISQTLRFLSLLSTDMDFCISSAELDFIPSTRLGFRRDVPKFLLRRPFAFVADRVINKERLADDRFRESQALLRIFWPA